MKLLTSICRTKTSKFTDFKITQPVTYLTTEGYKYGPLPSTKEQVSKITPYHNPKVPGYHQQIPLQPYPIGGLIPAEQYPQNANPPKLFEPLTIRGVEFVNRCWVAPMCMYSADDGKPTDHHFVHLGSMAQRGWGNIMFEATSVTPEGGISPEDTGLWSDNQIPSYKRIVNYIHAHHGKIGIQLGHAGRKASVVSSWVQNMSQEAGWEGGRVASEANGGWPNEVIAPSAISFDDETYPDPTAMTLQEIEDIKMAFLAAVERCNKIGFDFIEIHGAHGYLLHQFTSPLSNRRNDDYGGSLTNRLRFPLDLTKAIRKIWDRPLFYRLSATDWLEDSEGPEKLEKKLEGSEEEYKWWGLEQTTILASQLRDAGVDLLDVSTGGNDLRQNVINGPKYQVPFAAHIKKNVPNLLIGTVGNLTDAYECNDIIEAGEADVVFMARHVLRRIDFPLEAAQTLGVAVAPALQFASGWSDMMQKRSPREAESQ